MRKRLMTSVSLLLLCALMLSLCGCGSKDGEDDKLKIVCTLFPQYDWVRNIVGDTDGVEMSLLIQNGTDPHSYQPTAADIMEISDCDMIIYVGADSDRWVQEALARANNEDTVKIALTEIQGMTLHNVSSASHSHGEHEEHGHEGHDHGALDEHLWLSLSNAVVAIEHIAVELAVLDPDNSNDYMINTALYKSALTELDGRYRTAVNSAATRFMLFADRFPFVYLLSDYGVDFSAAFEGCTTDVDAGFDTVLRLINEAAEHDVGYIAVTETSDKALARTVADSSKKDIEIIVMDSLQSVSEKQLEGGISYLGVMESNLDALSVALGATGE